jgi:uncharacterized membrane protein (DUF4010 family)
MMTDPAGLAGIVVAALGGAAIGVERQRSGHATGRHARFGGVRTFTLLGGLAGLAGWLTTQDRTGIAIVLVAGAVALIVAGYVAASTREIDATTEAAALVVVAAGVVAGTGWIALASATVAVTVLLLVEKSKLHELVRRVDDEELRAAARFAVMAVVVLPLLPPGPFGPFGGIKPRALWLVVLLFTGLSFVGYAARRIFGTSRGYTVTGLVGGLISSTNVTLAFARMSREHPALAGPLATGVIAACTMLFPRVLVAAALLNPAVARHLLPYLAAPLLVGALIVAVRWRKGAQDPVKMQPDNPLQFRSALEMAVLFQVVLFAVNGAGPYLGARGLRVAGAILGLTDVDALTLSMTTTDISTSAPGLAAEVIAIGILANNLLKLGVAGLLGAPPFRTATCVLLAAMTAAIGIAIRFVP